MAAAQQIHMPVCKGRNSRNLKVHTPGIVWSGESWACGKQLKHYSAFCINVSCRVHTFLQHSKIILSIYISSFWTCDGKVPLLLSLGLLTGSIYTPSKLPPKPLEVWAYEFSFGLIPNVRAKGKSSVRVADLLGRMQVEEPVNTSDMVVPEINTLILIDREVDMVTPMCTQLTYEGLLDEATPLIVGLAVTTTYAGKYSIQA